MRARAWPILALGAACLAGAGCVAPIQEQRSYGPSWPSADSRRQKTEEQRDAGPVVRASATGKLVEVTVMQQTECRTVTVTDPMVREVVTRRSFADRAPQDIDAAAAVLLLVGSGFALYDSEALACDPKDPAGCRDRASSAIEPMAIAAAVLALIPLGLATYNVARARDDRRVERAEPAVEAGPWSVCKARPLGDEKVEVVVGDREARAITGADGRAIVDLSPLVTAGAETAAVVKHAGSPDVALAVP